VSKKPWPALMLAFVVLALAPLSAGATSTRPSGVVPALDYLHARQTADGAIGGSALTPWAVLAISAARENPLRWQIGGKDPVLGYLQNLNLDAAALDPATTINPPAYYARAILAFAAAGRKDLIGSAGNPRISLPLKLNAFRDSSDGHYSPDTYGSRSGSSVTTTLWAILALHAAGGYDGYINDPTTGGVPWLRSQQHGDGGFASEPGAAEDIDDTALAIQALRAGATSAASTLAITNAVAYLAAHQRNDGGFGHFADSTHSFAESTAAAIQGLLAAGELPADGSTPAKWTKSGGATPYRCLRRLQLSSGLFQHRAGVTTNAVLTTAEAVIALSHKSFPFTRASTMFTPAWLPHFKSVSPAQGAHFSSGSVTIKANYTDNSGGTGISTKLTTITVDGVSRTAHASVTSGSLILRRDAYASGTHTFVIKLSDKAGNARTVTRQFTVSGTAPSTTPTSTPTGGSTMYPSSTPPTYTSPTTSPTGSMSPTTYPTYPSGSPSVTGLPMSPSPSASPSASAAAAPSGGSGNWPSAGAYAGLALLAMLPLGAAMSYWSYRRRLGLLANAGKGRSLGSLGTGWSRFKRRLFGVTGLSHLIRR
jgi:hypothetical protein